MGKMTDEQKRERRIKTIESRLTVGTMTPAEAIEKLKNEGVGGLRRMKILTAAARRRADFGASE